ncbi:hypothetical protein SLA2020_276900 [Shorea laevis]
MNPSLSLLIFLFPRIPSFVPFSCGCFLSSLNSDFSLPPPPIRLLLWHLSPTRLFRARFVTRCHSLHRRANSTMCTKTPSLFVVPSLPPCDLHVALLELTQNYGSAYSLLVGLGPSVEANVFWGGVCCFSIISLVYPSRC